VHNNFQSFVFVKLFSFSDINPAAVDLVKYPDFAKIPWSNFTIHAGDCLFLPKSKKKQSLLLQNLLKLQIINTVSKSSLQEVV